jgi:hypothetical protein
MCRSSEVSPVERHGDSIAAGLAQCGGGNLDDPKASVISGTLFSVSLMAGSS